MYFIHLHILCFLYRALWYNYVIKQTICTLNWIKTLNWKLNFKMCIFLVCIPHLRTLVLLHKKVYIYIYILRVILFSISCKVLVLPNIQNLKVLHNCKIYRTWNFITHFKIASPWTLQSISWMQSNYQINFQSCNLSLSWYVPICITVGCFCITL